MDPQPDLVMITGDHVEKPSDATYSHFDELIAPLKAPVFLIPGNHDDPEVMWKHFGGTSMFPGKPPCYQYVIDDYDFRILALNSHLDDTELPKFGEQRLRWLEEELARIRQADPDCHSSPADENRSPLHRHGRGRNGTGG